MIIKSTLHELIECFDLDKASASEIVDLFSDTNSVWALKRLARLRNPFLFMEIPNDPLFYYVYLDMDEGWSVDARYKSAIRRLLL